MGSKVICYFSGLVGSGLPEAVKVGLQSVVGKAGGDWRR